METCTTRAWRGMLICLMVVGLAGCFVADEPGQAVLTGDDNSNETTVTFEDADCSVSAAPLSVELEDVVVGTSTVAVVSVVYDCAFDGGPVLSFTAGLSGDAEFSAVAVGLDSMGPGSSGTILVEFAPQDVGLFTGVLVVESALPAITLSVALIGRGVEESVGDDDDSTPADDDDATGDDDDTTGDDDDTTGDDDDSTAPPVESDCTDGVDNDGDGQFDCADPDCATATWCTDGDGDGWTDDEGDCNDSSASVYPGAPELCNDGIDQDCSGSDLSVDVDGDGYQDMTSCAANGDDCDDTDATVHPFAPEVCGDGVDQDCYGGPDDVCTVACTRQLVGSFAQDPSWSVDFNDVVACTDWVGVSVCGPMAALTDAEVIAELHSLQQAVIQVTPTAAWVVTQGASPLATLQYYTASGQAVVIAGDGASLTQGNLVNWPVQDPQWSCRGAYATPW